MRHPVSQFGRTCVGLLAAWLLTGSPARADENVYLKAVSSTVLIVTPDGGIGSGVLVDADRRLVITADHVPGKHDAVAVVFPEFDRTGRPITDKSHYAKSGGAIRGKVLARRSACDLALIELDSVPVRARAMTLSVGGAREGQAVHVIGNSNVTNGALFGCVGGQVRNVFTKEARAKNTLAGRVVLTSVATNRGDSGGPLVDGKGELVGIVSGGSTGGGTDSQQVVDYCVDVSEVRTLLDAHRPPPVAVAAVKKPFGSRPALAFNPYELQPAERVATATAMDLWQPPSPGDRAERLFPPLPLQPAPIPAGRR